MFLRISGNRPRTRRPQALRPLVLFVIVVMVALGLSVGGEGIATALLISLGALALTADLTPRLAPAEGVG
ncbi:hypothetical protein HNR23_002019 [Nocardiopsis mwathae]|uniref:Uncharacterized protein n=1 Tax=Nocardiopsis mwathae TaxID=1472723 RepID=A0A7W9YH30_9ACTN|nr:hypothetical protein [Nocardiopsis mwathae]MBB6171959.1 hypothetical protein [Nocardiopsis mwathae]